MIIDHALGVQQSLTGRSWVWRSQHEERIGLGLAQQLGVPELMGRLLAARGVSAAHAPDYLDPTLRAMLPDPSSIIDMDEAAARMADAVCCGNWVARCSTTCRTACWKATGRTATRCAAWPNAGRGC